MNYWVREHPPAAKGNDVEHWMLLGGERGCNQITDPLRFPTWDMAQAMANALANNAPTDLQRMEHEGETAYRLKREGTKGDKALEAWRQMVGRTEDTETLQRMERIENEVGLNDH